MNEKKQDKQNENSNFISYRWNKNWVRPHESVYSIIRNFCSVNVMSEKTAMKIFGIGSIQINTEKYVAEIGIYSHLKYNTNYSKLKEILFPDEHFNDILYKIENSFAKYYIKNKINYCPECMKQNYHSIYHQITGIEYCPFHNNILLTKTEYSYLMGNLIRYEFDEKIALDNAAYLILPVEVSEIPELYDFKINNNIKKIQSTSCGCDIPGIEWESGKFLISASQSIEPVLCIKQIPSFYDINKEIIARFQFVKQPAKYVHENTWYFGNTVEKTVNTYIELILFVKMMELYQTVKEQIENDNDFSIYLCERLKKIEKNNLPALVLHFLWLVSGVNNMYDVLTPNWILHPLGACNRDVRGIYYFKIRHMYKPLEKVGLEGLSEENIYIYCKIVEECFDYLWKQWIHLAEKDGFIDIEEGWKKMKIPEYCIMKNLNDTIHVYRNELYIINP